MRLTGKQLAFVNAYCSPSVAFNATEASRRAGYKGNENTLSTVGYENLQKPAIRAEIEKRVAEAVFNENLTIEKVLRDIEITRVRSLATGKLGVAIRCSELQGKYLGLWVPKELNGPTLEELSIDQLTELAIEVFGKANVDLKSVFFPAGRCEGLDD
jgi:hypothetical protein